MVEKYKFLKPLLMIDEIIYPKNLYNLLKDYLKPNLFLPSEFGRDCIRVMVVFDDDDERLDKICKDIQKTFGGMVESVRTLIFDTNETEQVIKDIIKQIENGIPEKSFYEWFMLLGFQLSQNNLPCESDSLKIKKGYLPCSRIEKYKMIDGETNKIMYHKNYIWFSSNGSLMNEGTLMELRKRIDKKIYDKINKKERNKKIKRNPLDSKLRHEVFKRDNYTCVECGATNKDKILHCDHIVPVSKDGTDELDNLQTLCDDCNLAKSDKTWIGNLNKINGDDNGELSKTS